MGSYYGYTPTLIHAGVGSIIARGAEVVANITMEGAKTRAGMELEGAKTRAGMKIEGAKTRAGIVMSSAEARSKLMLEGAKMNLEYQMFKEKLAADKQQHEAEMAYKYAALNRSSGGGGGGDDGINLGSGGGWPSFPAFPSGGKGLDGTNFVPPDDPYPSDAAAVNPFAKSSDEGELVVFRPDGSDRSGTGYITREDGTGVYIDDTTRGTQDRIGTYTADTAPEWAPPRPTQDNTFVGPLQPDETTPNEMFFTPFGG